MPPTQSLRSELRSLPRAFWVLCAGMFITRFGTFVYPFLTIILHRRGFGYGDIGLAVGSFGAGGLVAAFAGGWFADRFGRRHAIVLGTSGNALFIFLLYWAQSLPAIMLCAGLAGFMGGFFQPAGSALVADLVPEPLRLRAYSALRLAINAGFAFGTATGGILVNHSAFWLFAGDALTTAAYGLLAFWMLPHGLRQTSTQVRWGEAFARLRHDGRFWALVGAQFCAAMIMLQSTSAYSLEVARRGLVVKLPGWEPTPEQLFGLLIGWNGLLIVGCELSLTRVTQRFEPRRVMCLGYLLLGGGFALNAVPGGLGVLLTAMTVFTLGEMLAIPMGSTFVARIAPLQMRGRYMGVLSTSWSAASVVGPQLGLRLYGVHPALPWLTCGGLGLVAVFTLWRYGDGVPEN